MVITKTILVIPTLVFFSRVRYARFVSSLINSHTHTYIKTLAFTHTHTRTPTHTHMNMNDVRKVSQKLLLIEHAYCYTDKILYIRYQDYYVTSSWSCYWGRGTYSINAREHEFPSRRMWHQINCSFVSCFGTDADIPTFRIRIQGSSI